MLVIPRLTLMFFPELELLSRSWMMFSFLQLLLVPKMLGVVVFTRYPVTLYLWRTHTHSLSCSSLHYYERKRDGGGYKIVVTIKDVINKSFDNRQITRHFHVVTLQISLLLES